MKLVAYAVERVDNRLEGTEALDSPKQSMKKGSSGVSTNLNHFCS